MRTIIFFLGALLINIALLAQSSGTLSLETLNSATAIKIADDQNRSNKTLIMDEEKSTGKKVFVWQESDDPVNSSPNRNIYCMVYDKNMVPLFPSKILVNSNQSLDQAYPSVLVNQLDNSFYVAWSGNHSGSYDIYVKRLSFDNAKIDAVNVSDLLVNSEYVANRQIRPMMTYDYNYKELIIGWLDQDGQDGSGYGGFAKRIKLYPNNYHDVREGQFLINNITNNHQSLISIGINPVTQELYTVSQSIGYGLPDDYDIIFRKFKRTPSGYFGNQGQPEQIINSYKIGLQGNAHLTINSLTGDYLVTWVDWTSRSGGGNAAYSKIFDKFNNEVKPEFLIRSSPIGNHLYARAIWDESSGSIVFFYSYYTGNTTNLRYQIYDENFQTSGIELDALNGVNTFSGYGWSHSVHYSQQNKKIFLSYDIRPYDQAPASIGMFRQYSFLPPSPLPPEKNNSMNYVEVQTILKPIQDISSISTLGTSDMQINRTYLDGLGRPIQKVFYKGSPNKKDIIVPIEYDNAGRSVKSYLPYTATSGNLTYRPNALNNVYSASDQYKFYNNGLLNNIDRIVNDNYPYSETRYESDEFERVGEFSAPGNSWRLDNLEHTNVASQNIGYADDNVRIWTFANDIAQSSATYANFRLLKSSIKDLMGRITQTYIDLRGRLILTRVIPRGCTSTACYLDTYNIYDDLDNIIITIPPEVVSALQTTGGTWSVSYNGLDNNAKMIFGYKYDKRQRLIERLVPGKGVEYFVYNQQNLLVLSQEANQRATNHWTFRKYDALGRYIEQGVISDARPRDVIQASFAAYPLYEKKDNSTSTGYTNLAYPITIDDNVHFISYFDDHSNPSIPYNYTPLGVVPEPIAVPNNLGRLTGSKIKNFGDNNWLVNILIYDKYGNIIQKRSNNHKNYNIASFETRQYNFAGSVTFSKSTTHTHSDILNIKNRYEYDHTGRLIKLFQTSGTDREILMSHFNYNELGQLVEKNLHSENQGSNFLQSMDYTYNIRGWLTGINSLTGNSLTSATPLNNNNDMNDIYSSSIGYDNVLSGIGNTPMYNGSVSGIKYRIANNFTSNRERAYLYLYDPYYRLSSSTAAQNYSEVFNFENNSCKEIMSYDKNGNIKTLKRYNYGSQNPAMAATLIDDLSYTYSNSTVKGGNKVVDVTDLATKQGFNKRSTSSPAYSYDANGNMSRDLNKGIFNILYNYLNLPTKVSFTSDDWNYIAYTYDASGKMLSKKIVRNGAVIITSDYINNMYYENNVLKYFKTSEGRACSDGASGYSYQYDIKDHLGNVMVTFDKNPSGGYRVIQDDDYYAFGGRVSGLSYRVSTNAGINNFLYGGKEYQEGLNTSGGASNDYDWDVYDMSARMYDPVLGRFHVVDAHANSYSPSSPYSYAFNSPINYNDPSGNDPASAMMAAQQAQLDAQMAGMQAQASAQTAAIMQATTASINSMAAQNAAASQASMVTAAAITQGAMADYSKAMSSYSYGYSVVSSAYGGGAGVSQSGPSPYGNHYNANNVSFNLSTLAAIFVDAPGILTNGSFDVQGSLSTYQDQNGRWKVGVSATGHNYLSDQGEVKFAGKIELWVDGEKVSAAGLYLPKVSYIYETGSYPMGETSLFLPTSGNVQIKFSAGYILKVPEGISVPMPSTVSKDFTIPTYHPIFNIPKD